jgi:PRC-barrel domain protein
LASDAQAILFSKHVEARMLKKLMVTTAVSALMIGAAAAQSSPQPSPSSPSSPPPAAQSQPAPAPMAQADSKPLPASGSAQFVNKQDSDQWLSQTFIGTDVVGADDAKIGDITDILFTKDGKVVAYVVGVGGFLGIGAKNVALAPSAFQPVPASSGTTGSAGTAPRSDDIKLKLPMTKDQLQQAAAFESKRDQDAKARAASSGTGSSPGGMAPRPTSPSPTQQR